MIGLIAGRGSGPGRRRAQAGGTQEQLREMVALAQSADAIYRPPGHAAIERDA